MLYASRTDIPLIFKVCDPCAVFKGPKWLAGKFTYPGQDATQVEGERAIRFVSHAFGINAACWTLLGYQQRGLKTVKAMIEEYAPPAENLTQAYIARVSRQLRVQPTDPINVRDERVMKALIKVIIMVECGPNPPKDILPANWVEEAEIDRGVKMGLGMIPRTAPPTPPQPQAPGPLTSEEERNLIVPLNW